MARLSEAGRTGLLLMVLAAVATSCLPAFAQGQNETANIVGQVRVGGGNTPSERVMVNLTTRGLPFASTYTDDEGRFVFYDLPANPYHVTIDNPEFFPVDMVVAVNPAITRTNMVQLLLITKAKKPMDAEAPAGSNPYLVAPAEYNKRFPGKVTKEFEKGLDAQREGKTEAAIRHYEKAVHLAPEFYLARNNLGSLYMSKGDFQAAQAEFEQVIKINQADAAAYFNLGNVYLLRKRPDEALDFIRQGLARQPASALGHFLMGSVMLDTGNWTEAERYLRSAVTEDPNLANAHLSLVNLYVQQRRNADAVEELSAFLKQSPESGFAPQARQLLKKLQSQPVVPQ